MPIYEYQCNKCGDVFEAIQKFSDAPLRACRLCGDGTVKKLLSAPAFRLKGGGWYETDFKKDKQKNLVKSDDRSVGTKSDDKGTEPKAGSKGAESTSERKASSTSSGKASDTV